MDQDGQNTTNITISTAGNFRAPSWSPNGSQIAVMKSSSNFDEVYIMNNDGTNITFVTSDAYDWFYGSLAWSPDGKKIVFTKWDIINPVIAVINTDGSNLIILTTPLDWNQMPAWSPWALNPLEESRR